MRQSFGRTSRLLTTKLVVILCLVFLLQPLAGCSDEQPGTAPTVRIDSTVTTAGLQSGPAAAAGPATTASPSALETNPETSAGSGATPTPPANPVQATTQVTSAMTATTESTGETSESTRPDPTTQQTAKPTAKPTPKPTAKPTPKPSPYYLYCELGTFTIQVYGLDASGKYTVPVRRIRTAIGRGSMTPRGKFKLGSRERWHTFGSTSYAQYAIKYHSSGLYLHSPLYSSKNIRKLQSWSYKAIGTKNTSGCLRMPTGDIYWIYRNCPAGTVLEIVSGTPRGLSPPALRALVRSNEDPTDPLLG